MENAKESKKRVAMSWKNKDFFADLGLDLGERVEKLGEWICIRLNGSDANVRRYSR
jgi:hypothetical protein